MRLKEIEARLAQIRNELNTRAAELTGNRLAGRAHADCGAGREKK